MIKINQIRKRIDNQLSAQFELNIVHKKLTEPLLLGKVKLEGAPIDKQTVKRMVGEYRGKHPGPSKSIKFVCYSVMEMLDLLLANDVITKTAYDQCKISPDIDKKGIKLYMSTHKTADDCPIDRQTGRRKDHYLTYDTIIMCNTELKNKQWDDMLRDGKDSITIFGNGDALEQGGLCPPECDTDDSGNALTDIFP